MTSVRSSLLFALLLAIPGAGISAQVRSVPPARRDTVRPRPDSLGRDTTRRDSTASKELIKWNEADSVMKALMLRQGYTATRYQGDQVIYDARTRTLHLIGKKAGVSRDQCSRESCDGVAQHLGHRRRPSEPSQSTRRRVGA